MEQNEKLKGIITQHDEEMCFTEEMIEKYAREHPDRVEMPVAPAQIVAQTRQNDYVAIITKSTMREKREQAINQYRRLFVVHMPTEAVDSRSIDCVRVYPGTECPTAQVSITNFAINEFDLEVALSTGDYADFSSKDKTHYFPFHGKPKPRREYYTGYGAFGILPSPSTGIEEYAKRVEEDNCKAAAYLSRLFGKKPQ